MQIDCLLSDGRTAHLRRSADALTVAIGSEHVYTFDLGGRLIGVFRRGENLRRGLDGRVLARWRAAGGPRQRRWLEEAQIDAMFAEVQSDLRLIPASELPLAQAEPLQRALAFAPQADARRFQHVYRPISILPPDQYQALVLQTTEGCSFNTCTFCALYRDRPFRIKSAAEFAAHIQAVKEFFGEGLGFRRSIFLADANALVIPQARLLPLFDELARAFAVAPVDLPSAQRRAWLAAHPHGVSGVFAFVDGLSAERKHVDDFAALRERGLRRVYIGLESGDEALLAWLRKPSTAAAMVEAVQRMKAAGLSLGVVVLTGIGGDRFDADHIAHTAAALNAMPLDGDDILYFSPFQPDAEAPYAELAAAAGIEPASPARAQRQEAAIRSALTLSAPPAGPKRAPYDLRDFVY